MKHLYVIILLSLSTIIQVHGQEIKKHVVQRGETLESIAKDYNLSPNELHNANNDMEIFYTGLEINVPIKKTMIASTGTKQSSNSDEQFLKTLAAYWDDCEIANKLFETHNYSKAQKQYQQPSKSTKASYHVRMRFMEMPFALIIERSGNRL